MSSQETKRPDKLLTFNGAWMPGTDPLFIGEKNFTSLENMIPTQNGLCGCLGYSKVTSEALSTYYRAQAGIQIRTKDSLRSGVYVQAKNSAGTQSAIMAMEATNANDDIPYVKNFTQTPVYIDAPGAGSGRFSRWPQNHIAYCNGKETLVYAGPEMPPAKVLWSSGDNMEDIPSSPVDYTEAMTNTLNTLGNTMRMGKVSNTCLLLYIQGNGNQGSQTIPDVSTYAQTITAKGNAQIDQSYKVFGSGSVKYDGDGDYLSLPYSSQWALGTSPFCISLYRRVNTSNDTRWRGLIGQYQNSSNYWFLASSYSKFNNTMSLAFKAVYSDQTIADYVTGNVNINSDFNHIAFTRVGENVFFFINGKKISATVNQAIGNSSMPSLTDTNITIGYGGSVYGTEHGWHDEVMFWKGSGSDYLYTEEFTPPASEYAGPTNNYITVFTRRPIQAITPYISATNKTSEASLSGRYWDGTGYSTLNITDGSSGLSINQGRISFPSTVGVAKPRLMFGDLFYVYQFALSSGSAELYRLTVDAPWQPPVDLWDGVLYPLRKLKHDANNMIDATELVADDTPLGVSDTTYYTTNIGGLEPSEKIYIRSSVRLCGLRVKMYDRVTGKVNTNASVLSLYFWDGNQYMSVQGLNDGTSSGGKTFALSGDISWTPSDYTQEQIRRIENEKTWSYKITVSATLSGTCLIDKIEGIPAPNPMNNLAYRFPMMLGNRPLLCGLLSTGEGNRIDFAMTDTTEVWNGNNSSLGEECSPLYVGDSEDLVAGCEIFNRLGQNIYTFGLFLKATQTYILNGYDAETYRVYQLNNKVGCASHQTLDTYTIETDKTLGARTIAAWLSFSGPYVFDSAGLNYLPGLECYFDKTDSRCINYSAIENAVGWFDPQSPSPRYNLQFPSGANQTTNNVWVFYDFDKNQWYLKKPSCEYPYFDAVVRVNGPDYNQYIYGFRPNGYPVRLDHGTTWDDSPISQHIETGEIMHPETIWQVIKNVMMKLIYIPTSEEDVNLTVSIYTDGNITSSAQLIFPLTKPTGYTARYMKMNKYFPPMDCLSYRLRFSTTTSQTSRGMQLLACSVRYAPERKDLL